MSFTPAVQLAEPAILTVSPLLQPALQRWLGVSLPSSQGSRCEQADSEAAQVDLGVPRRTYGRARV